MKKGIILVLAVCFAVVFAGVSFGAEKATSKEAETMVKKAVAYIKALWSDELGLRITISGGVGARSRGMLARPRFSTRRPSTSRRPTQQTVEDTDGKSEGEDPVPVPLRVQPTPTTPLLEIIAA